MLSLNDNMWVLFLGPLLNTLMFVFISVPLAEKHQLAKNPQYKEYVRTTNTFLLFPKKEVEEK
jgi:steroid 5-alpha reductase family enzyme